MLALKGYRVKLVRSLNRSRRISGVLRELVVTGCLAIVTSSLVTLPLAAADKTASKPSPLTLEARQGWTTPLSQDEKILQLLNRVTFGPRRGDVERVERMGITKFLDEQLHPERIDDSAVEAKVAALPTLSMSTEELAEDFQEMRAERRAQPNDRVGQKPEQASFLDVLKSGKPGVRQHDSQARAGSSSPAAGDAMTASAPASTAESPATMPKPEVPLPQRVIMELAQEEVLRAVYSNRQLEEVMVQFWMNHFNIFAPKGADRWLTTSFERDTIRPHALGKFEDLLAATAESPAMLFYLDNWMSTTPNPTFQRRLRPSQGRRGPLGGRRYGVWRPFGGPFGQPPRPASSAPAARPAPPAANKARRGLNENYGRELMELHTLGVDGGYTQKDVIEVARCLTGWTIDRPGQGGGFVFRPQMHDFGEKVVLAHKISAGHGMEDGLKVLRILAHQPATAQFISLKLCRRFVSDDPPPSLVDRAAKTFLEKDGDLRAVLKTILTSSEFYSQAAYRAKVKSPIELVASTIRALGASTDASAPLLQFIARMGQPMFQYQAPTGFPDRASTWINSSALLMRMNFALMLAANRIPGTQVDLASLDAPSGVATSHEVPSTLVPADSVAAGVAPATADGAPVDRAIDQLAGRLFHGTLSPETRQTILKEMTGGATGRSPTGPIAWKVHAQPGSQTLAGDSAIAAFLIASPDFQRR